MNRNQRRAGARAGAPASPQFQRMFAQGAAAYQAGRLPVAAAAFRQAVALKPGHADAQANLGLILLALGEVEEAARCCRRALAADPSHTDAHNTLGNALRQTGQMEAATACYRRAIALDPRHADAHNNLGVALKTQGAGAAAIASYRHAIASRPSFAEAHNNLGNALREAGELESAATCYSQALRLRPDYADAHSNLGLVLDEQRRLDEAAAQFRQAIRLRPDLPGARFNLSLTLLAQGALAEGWREYEWRWQTPHIARQWRDFPQPQWRGEPAEGQTLLIHAEQGFGDTLQFCRYAPLATARGLRVVLEVPKPLLRLLRGLPSIADVVARGDDLPPFDLHCPMMSLPLAFGTTLATIPAAGPYLHAMPEDAWAWQRRLEATGRRQPRIGLAWAGRETNPRDSQRSLDAARLAPLLGIPGLHWVNLQQGGSLPPPVPPLTDWMPEMADFADTAALIEGLDLVVAVDTAVTHLAAGLGKPVWMLDRFNPDWRWLDGRKDSPWYPTLQIYRQPRPGDWATVIADVAQDLRVLAGAPARAFEQA